MMKMWVKFVIGAGCAAAAGAGGYFGWKLWGKGWWARRKEKNAPLSVEYFFDVKEADRVLKEEIDKDPRSHPIVKDEAETDLPKEKFAERLESYISNPAAKENFEQYMAGMESPEEEEDDDEDEEEMYDEDEPEEDIHRGSEEPYMITRGEFYNTRSYYDKISVNYYEDDNVVADGKDEVLTNARHILGDLQEAFGGEDAPNTAYIRNEPLEIDYEVNLVRGSYHEEVLLKMRGDPS